MFIKYYNSRKYTNKKSKRKEYYYIGGAVGVDELA
jgi:hypothetical protein